MRKENDMTNNQTARAAKRIIHAQHHVLPHVPREALPHVVRGFAQASTIPKTVMLKAMARYVRLHTH